MASLYTDYNISWDGFEEEIWGKIGELTNDDSKVPNKEDVKDFIREHFEGKTPYYTKRTKCFLRGKRIIEKEIIFDIIFPKIEEYLIENKNELFTASEICEDLNIEDYRKSIFMYISDYAENPENNILKIRKKDNIFSYTHNPKCLIPNLKMIENEDGSYVFQKKVCLERNCDRERCPKNYFEYIE